MCQLADEETPTSTSGNLCTSGRVVANVDDEDENYNDISSKLCSFNLLLPSSSSWSVLTKFEFLLDRTFVLANRITELSTALISNIRIEISFL